MRQSVSLDWFPTEEHTWYTVIQDDYTTVRVLYLEIVMVFRNSYFNSQTTHEAFTIARPNFRLTNTKLSLIYTMFYYS